VRAFFVCAWFLLGCSAEGRMLDRWLYAGTEVSLPASSLLGVLPDTTPYSLSVEVEVADSGPHTLVLDCFHGELALRVNGDELEDIGDTAVGEHRFVIPERLTLPATVTLQIEVLSDPFLLGIEVAPRLERGARMTPGPVAILNRHLALIDLAVIGVFTILFGLSFALDRRRVQDGAFAIGVMLSSVAPLAQLGLLTPLGVVAPVTISVGICGVNIAVVYFIHAVFDVKPLPRLLMMSYAVLAVATPLTLASESIAMVWGAILATVDLWFFIHVLKTLLAQRGPKRRDALALCAVMVVLIVLIAPDLGGFFFGHNVFGGVHTMSLGAIGFGLSQAIYLAREQVTRQRELARTAEELRRQIAERSRELSEALSRLAQQAQPLAADRVIDGRYRVIRKLGVGGMGAVYEVERISDGQRFALKTLRGRADRDLMARFAREAQIAAEISHPHLVPVLDVGIADGALFLVMPLVAGGSLEHARAKFGDVAWANPLLRQIAEGLAALHARDIVHRDLKPGNILLADGKARIADFGLAALGVDSLGQTLPSSDALADTAALPLSPLTRRGDVFGTPAYMAPELAGGAQDAKPSSDIFGFGIIAYELLTGRQPFAEPPVMAVLHGRTLADPRVDDVPLMIARCLALDPAKRPTAAELLNALP
jgi:serine/threonine-protein kinase